MWAPTFKASARISFPCLSMQAALQNLCRVVWFGRMLRRMEVAGSGLLGGTFIKREQHPGGF